MRRPISPGDDPLTWLRVQPPDAAAQERLRQWLVGLPCRPLSEVSGSTPEDTVKRQRRARLRRYLRSQTLDGLLRLSSDAGKPMTLRRAAWAHARYRHWILPTTQHSPSGEPLLPVVHRHSETRQRAVLVDGKIVHRAAPRRKRLARRWVRQSTINAALRDQQQVLSYLSHLQRILKY